MLNDLLFFFFNHMFNLAALYALINSLNQTIKLKVKLALLNPVKNFVLDTLVLTQTKLNWIPAESWFWYLCFWNHDLEFSIIAFLYFIFNFEAYYFVMTNVIEHCEDMGGTERYFHVK